MVSQDIITAACARALITPSHTVELQQSIATGKSGKVTRLLLYGPSERVINAQSSLRG
jgi:hypothetical protein